VISKSYTPVLKSNNDEDVADINTPIEPDVGGVVPLEPLKFNPVPSAAKELLNVI
jgi:hypothetical protein